jgi:peptide-methionine (R)-S-oxide reductase
MNRREFLLGLGGATAVFAISPWMNRFLAGMTDSTPEGSLVKVRLMGEHGQLTAPMEVPKVIKTDAEWRKQLSSNSYDIARG